MIPLRHFVRGLALLLGLVAGLSCVRDRVGQGTAARQGGEAALTPFLGAARMEQQTVYREGRFPNVVV
ncbi:MAG: hypothetical protein IT580_16890, partial [Verrucomicrobiales bacterium]|nr:hypothetical protein [Verrucomicrobiales bacterium]